ncbi:hypothetical protein CHARACLAT_029022 [Characodon lateralis]|uniref:Cystinosin n=1 Tax=Characodon lateralis TaxID=208331 RepID=A0ABU7DV49_9TELE|nr:hypothetical protein [Characodon lateralis]
MADLYLVKKCFFAKLVALYILINSSESTVFLSAPDAVTVEQKSSSIVTISSSSAVNQSTVIHLNVTYSSKDNYSSIIRLPEQVFLPEKATSVSFTVIAHDVGQVTTYLLSNNTDLNNLSARIRFIVIHSSVLSVVTQVIGWIYFLAWSVSFYPQAWENWKRKR